MIKTRQRVIDHGEVFTDEREVNAMLDLVKSETQRIDSRFLEPACGSGNFLIEVLRRKLEIVEERYGRGQLEFERYSILALGSIYGVDLLEDNVSECRDRLYDHFNDIYSRCFGPKCRDECRSSARYVLDRNIVCGDALTMTTVGRRPEPIVFSEWSPVNGSLVKRRDYSLAHLLVYQPMEGPSLFSDLGEEAFIPKPVREFPLTHYLKLAEAAHA
ncbi:MULTISPECIES: restriction endonuclease subunit M [unclassified Sphingobium]|uniref:restriction endonuclease subunit M n=1 Tax=unclassified Sphingobium TaxID=2611147 RepID=UPI0005CC8803|nr:MULTISPECIES: restriction endonuclease subunit M [unclassified Sphingobium]AJR24369.1 restriction endonuclease subunit M [Sphingobium sp. YBL2]AMK16771.1 type III restriction system methylase [Sphingobium sp. MI1205]